MEYLILFIEGIVTFISPCLLPLLPVYISYFAGQDSENNAVLNSIGFVSGFTLVFIVLGMFAGALGGFLTEYGTFVNIVLGVTVIIFGLSISGIINIPFLSGYHRLNITFGKLSFFSSLLFGIVFSIGWTPCVGAFLGSALILAASTDSMLRGLLMLLCFSLGLGLPFIISAVLIKRVKLTFDFFKKHRRLINLISGGLLIIMGIIIATGKMNLILSAFG